MFHFCELENYKDKPCQEFTCETCEIYRIEVSENQKGK